MSTSSDSTITLAKDHPVRDLTLVLVGFAFLTAVALLTISRAASWRSHAHSGWVNAFDTASEAYLNRFAGRSHAFDESMTLFSEHNLIKGAPIVFLYWVAFFPAADFEDERLRKRRKLAAAAPLALFALALTRVLALILPFRDRPLETMPHFHIPFGELPAAMLKVFSNSSSFPSDHAALFTALAVGIWFGSRRLGAIAIAYTALAIDFPRIYLGLHWPTDILAGALIGAGIAALAVVPAYQERFWQWMMKWWRRSPGTLAASAFLLSYEITDLFDSPIHIMLTLLKHH